MEYSNIVLQFSKQFKGKIIGKHCLPLCSGLPTPALNHQHKPIFQKTCVFIETDFNKFFILKYGKPYALACVSNGVGTVSEKLMHKMSVQAPPKLTIEKYMIEIAKYYNVEYEPDPQVIQSMIPLRGMAGTGIGFWQCIFFKFCYLCRFISFMLILQSF